MKGRFMIVRDYGSKLFLLFVFSMVGMVYCNAQWKEFARKESNVYGFTGRWGCAVLAGRERDRVSAP